MRSSFIPATTPPVCTLNTPQVISLSSDWRRDGALLRFSAPFRDDPTNRARPRVLGEYEWGRTGGDWGGRRSVDGQDLAAAGAAARATNVAGIAGGGLYDECVVSRAGDHGGSNVDRELGAADHGGREGDAIEDHNGSGNKMAAGSSDDESGRQLRKDHGCWRDRVEDRHGASAPAEGIQCVAPRQEQEHQHAQTEKHDPKGMRHELSVTYLTGQVMLPTGNCQLQSA